MEPQQGTKTWQWVITVIVVIALIIVGIMVFGSKKTTPVTEETQTPSATTGTDSIVISDQFPGNVVYVSTVSASKPVWVAIHEDKDGQPGAVMGYAHYDAGTNPGGKITLSKSTVDGKTYYAVMHTDDGDSTFDATKDAPTEDAKGNVIMRVFHASSLAGSQIKG